MPLATVGAWGTNSSYPATHQNTSPQYFPGKFYGPLTTTEHAGDEVSEHMVYWGI